MRPQQAGQTNFQLEAIFVRQFLNGAERQASGTHSTRRPSSSQIVKPPLLAA